MILCQNHGQGAPGCLELADDRYTMDFGDIGKGKIYWCASCGPQSHAMEKAIMEAFETRPGFAKEFEKAIEEAERKIL